MAADVPESRPPTPEELELIREVIDPEGAREREVPDPRLRRAVRAGPVLVSPARRRHPVMASVYRPTRQASRASALLGAGVPGW